MDLEVCQKITNRSREGLGNIKGTSRVDLGQIQVFFSVYNQGWDCGLMSS